MKIRIIQPQDIEAVLALWEDCQLFRPANRAAARTHALDKLANDPELFLVGVQSGKIIATVIADGLRRHRGFLRYVAVAAIHRRQGYARALLAHAEKLLRRRGCQTIRLHVQSANKGATSCYRRLGYTAETLTMLKRLAPTPKNRRHQSRVKSFPAPP